MAVEVRVYANPSLERSVVHKIHILGDQIAVKSGALEIRDRGQVIVAYGAGHWIDAEVKN